MRPFAFRKVQRESYNQGPKQFQLVGNCYVEKMAWNDLEHSSNAPQYVDIV